MFGTRIELQLHSVEPARADPAIAEVGAMLQQLHRELHPWEPGALTTLNQALAEGREAVIGSDLLAELITLGALYERSSLGHFNPAIGGLVRTWGFHTSEYPITTPPPDAAAIALWLPAPSMAALTIADDRLSSTDPRVQLDFSGLAKGLAVREACAVLARHGIDAAMINAGGDVGVCGSTGHPWRIAIRSPAGGVLEVLEVDRPMAVFTSGNYYRYREFDGRRWAHLLSPFSGQPVDRIVQASVIDPDPIKADAAATALIVAGPERWREVARSMNIARAVVVDEAGGIARYPAALGAATDRGATGPRTIE